MNLTTAQYAAAMERAHENVVLTSGAGCGKTAVLAHRFTQLLLTCPDQEDPLSRFVALTFTDKAALEMRERVGALLRDRAGHSRGADRVKLRQWIDYLPEARIMTIHSFCRHLLRAHAVEIGIDPSFTVLADELLTAELVHQASEQALIARLTAKDQAAACLLAELGFDRLCKELAWLIEHRTNIQPQDYASAEAILDRWEACRANDTREAWALLDTDGLRGQIASLLSTSCTSDTDALHLWRNDKLGLATAVLDNPDARTHGNLRSLDEKPGNLGSPKAWGGKDALKAFRSDIKAALAPLAELAVYAQPLTDADTRAAEMLCHLVALAQDVNGRFQQAKRARGVLDFTDLLDLAVRLLDRPHVRQTIASQIDQLLIDECQDTDALQMKLVGKLALVSAEAEATCKLCVIGDAKQSIYRFRGADLDVFAELCGRLGPDATIRLDQSFRTHDAGVTFANELFAPLMRNYEPISAHRQDVPPQPSVELLLADAPQNTHSDLAVELQAQLTAQRIARMVDLGETLVRDRDTGVYRPVRYRDIAILFGRMTKSLAFERALAARGIPYYVVAGTGFFRQQEVFDLLNLLTLVENPADDLAFVGVARSSLVGLTDDVLLHLARRAARPYALSANADALADVLSPADIVTLRELLDRVRHWNVLKDRVDLPTLLEDLLLETGYEAALLAQPHGKRKVGNVRMLTDHARRASAEGLSLTAFVARLSALTISESRHEQSASAAEADDVVRLMTVHKSKGLDFPVVIVPDLNAKGGARPGLLRDLRDWGTTLTRINPDDEDDSPVAVSVELPKRRDQQDDDAEAMRKYYVAITRHEDHLVLIGTNTRSKDGLFAPGSFLDHMARRSFLSDALQALGPDQPAMDVAYGPAGRYIARCQCLAPEIVRRSPGRNVSPLQQALNECASAGQFADLVTDAVIPAHADWLGPLPATVGKVDLAVTALSEFVQCPQHYQWRHALRVPGHLLATPSDRPAMPMVDAATAGTYFHRCMELTDFVTPGPTDAVTIQAADEAGLSHAVASPLAAEFAEMRQRFEATDLWARLAAANRLLRELDFTIDLGPAVLRGQIDVLFLGADGRWGVVDYKSDRLAATHTDAIALHSRHHRQQMLIYALAAGRYLGVDALPATLYYLRPGVSHTFDFTPEDIQAGLAQLQSQALDLITARRTGHFAPQPGPACQWCDYRSLCRPAQ